MACMVSGTEQKKKNYPVFSTDVVKVTQVLSALTLKMDSD
jgi:hypothetical protein